MTITVQKKVTINMTQLTTIIFKTSAIVMHSGKELGLLNKNIMFKTLLKEFSRQVI